MRTFLAILILASASVLVGCAPNTLSHDDDSGDLTVELRFSDEHLTTLLPTEVAVSLLESDGATNTDLASVVVEYRQEGTVVWAQIELEAHEDHYAAEHQFMTSGEFEFRVMGLVDEHEDLDEMFVMDGHAEIERAHQEMGGMRISYEHFPGEVQEGDEVEVRFWIEQGDGLGDGHGATSQMMGNLTAFIDGLHGDGSTQTHRAEEHETGVYEANHIFSSPGNAEMTVRFEAGGAQQQATFIVPVKENH
jgi:hypothetical protein